MLQIRTIVCNPFQENCYIVSDETNEAVIIDCGAFYGEERHEVVRYIKDERLDVCHLLETHAHIDHSFGNNTVFEEFGIQPELHIKDICLHETLKEQALDFANINIDYDMPSLGTLLSDTSVITFGNHKLKVIHTPGHTPGSVFYYCEEENCAFSGDTLFCMSIGRTDFEMGSYKDILKSLNMIVETLPSKTTILPGHGPKTTIERELKDNPFLRK